MRTLMSIAFALACSAGVFAADSGGGAGGVGGGASSAAQHPINSVDPVTGRPVDPGIPAVLVPDPGSLASNGSSGNATGGAAGGGMGGASSDTAARRMIPIGISERGSAEIIRSNPQLYLPAARANKRFDQVGQSSGAAPGVWEHGTDTSRTPGTGLDNREGVPSPGTTRSDSSVEQGSGHPDAGSSSGGQAPQPMHTDPQPMHSDPQPMHSDPMQPHSGSSGGMQPQDGSADDRSDDVIDPYDQNTGAGVDATSPQGADK